MSRLIRITVGHKVAAEVIERLGLHVTAGELAIWRDRAVNGPFKTKGDYSTNSPGDWDRAVAQKDYIIANPNENIYSPTSTPSSSSSEFPPYQPQGRRLRSCAFFHLVRHNSESTTTAMNTARDRLLAQAAAVDFSDRDIWPLNYWADGNPSFEICEWLMNHIYAYDYLRAYERDTGLEVFTTTQHNTMLDWLYHAADYWQEPVNRSLDSTLGLGRWDDPPTYNAVPTGTSSAAFHDTSQVFQTVANQRHYNNRKAQLARYPGIAGRMLLDEGYTPPAGADPGSSVQRLRDTGRLFVEEELKFATSAFPSLWSDSTRWTSTNPILGLAYGWAVVGTNLEIADTEARAGNPHLYNFATQYGQNGTETNFDKTLRYKFEYFQQMVREEAAVYGSDNLADDSFDYRIKMRTNLGGINHHRVRDTGGLQPALWYKDALITDTTLRKAAGAPAWPSSPIDAVHWEGMDFQLPGALFMFGDTGANPYPES